MTGGCCQTSASLPASASSGASRRRTPRGNPWLDPDGRRDKPEETLGSVGNRMECRRRIRCRVEVADHRNGVSRPLLPARPGEPLAPPTHAVGRLFRGEHPVAGQAIREFTVDQRDVEVVLIPRNLCDRAPIGIGAGLMIPARLDRPRLIAISGEKHVSRGENPPWPDRIPRSLDADVGTFLRRHEDFNQQVLVHAAPPLSLLAQV